MADAAEEHGGVDMVKLNKTYAKYFKHIGAKDASKVYLLSIDDWYVEEDEWNEKEPASKLNDKQMYFGTIQLGDIHGIPAFNISNEADEYFFVGPKGAKEF